MESDLEQCYATVWPWEQKALEKEIVYTSINIY